MALGEARAEGRPGRRGGARSQEQIKRKQGGEAMVSEAVSNEADHGAKGRVAAAAAAGTGVRSPPTACGGSCCWRPATNPLFARFLLCFAQIYFPRLPTLRITTSSVYLRRGVGGKGGAARSAGGAGGDGGAAAAQAQAIVCCPNTLPLCSAAPIAVCRLMLEGVGEVKPASRRPGPLTARPCPCTAPARACCARWPQTGPPPPCQTCGAEQD